MAWQYGVAQTVAVTFYSAGEPTAPTGALSATISKDGGAFASISGTVTQIGATACALLSLAIADTTCDAGVVKITDAGGTADDRYVEFTTEAEWTTTDDLVDDVWAAGSRTLTGFGTLVADVATEVWTAVARTITGGTVTTVSDKTGYALTAAYDAAQTAAQAADLATVAADVLRTLGLAQENQHIDNVTTDIYGRMTSARMRTYSAAGSVGTASDVLATYTITATYTGAEEAPTTYSVVRV